MKLAEKPFESLGSKEKEIVELCKEIILWGTRPENIKNSEALVLKQRATKLFEESRKIDFDYADNYYKINVDLDELKKDFEKAKDIKEDTYIYLNYDAEKILDNITRELKAGKNFIFDKDWPTDQEEYGDYIHVSVKCLEKNFVLIISEMFDSFIYENNLINQIKATFDKYDNNYKIKEYKHGDAIEYTIEYETSNREILQKVLTELVQSIEKTERILNKKQTN